MKSTEFLPSDYDAHGRLRLPVLFWGVLLLQARTWVLFAIASASRDSGNALLTLFYPDHDNFWFGLLPGVPAVLAFLLSGRRHGYPRLWAAFYPLLLVAQLAQLLWLPLMWLNGEPLSGMGLTLLGLDLFALWWLGSNPRLRAAFRVSAD
ncbi:DUF2919 family protein [Enterobacter sp. BIGb0383]|uniref:DUF2919 domain-containing protein n=1 Tax=unclassified Enterobacter TaxID=2608935 RepID=UPI000F46C585|nr:MULTISPECIES: DUF2919 domain-containing protein [unclassified Enterobacter]ROP63040.1 DUF2919 family protein [Enterobacter sp. BIGb0383]ROS13201.1 DUF2919 family protein [Enterobacter sp. BIGb0359]